MRDPVDIAIDAAVDGEAVDWDRLDAEAPGADTREMLRALRGLTEIARVHGATSRLPPFRWGPLEVRERVAHGVYGDVYRAWDPRLERQVALKLLRDSGADDEGGSVAIAEGKRLAGVHHPNVVTVYGADRIDGQVGIWMEFVDGSTLEAVVAAHGPLAPEEVARIGAAIATGLSAVHGAGIVHRDIKAQNVMVARDGRVILMDLGAGADQVSYSASMHGTPIYLAPELLAGKAATPASDIYALGVLLFFLLTGRYPAKAASLADLRSLHRAGRIERLASSPDLPPSLAAVIDRALSADSVKRFASADDLRRALEISTHRRFPRRSLLVIGLALVASTLTGLWIASSAGRPAQEANDAVRSVPLPRYPIGGPSRDGRFISYVAEDGSLMLWEVAQAKGTRVLAPGAEGVITTTLPSPDATRIAYGWRRADGRFELRSIGADGQWVTSLIAPQLVYEPMPVDWSADGRDVLCALRYPDGTTDIVLVAADGNGLRHVQRFGERGLVHARLSPDGRYVVSSIRRDHGSLGPVLIAPTDGSGSRSLLDGSDCIAPVWTPDGRHVLVLKLADPKHETLRAWLVPVEQGSTGKPMLTTLGNLNFPIDQWMTSEGLLYQSVTSIWADIYAASIDLSGKTAAGLPARLVQRDLAQQVAAAWSPDGRLLAYLLRSQYDGEGSFPTERLLMIMNLSDGTTRPVPVSLEFIGGYIPAWTPDSQALALWGRDGPEEANFGHFQVDISSGQAMLLARVGMLAPTYSQFTSDGTRFLYLHPKRGLVEVDLRSRVESTLIPHTRELTVGTFLLSPDGQKLAYAAWRRNGESRVGSLRVRAGVIDQELARFGTNERAVVHGWTTDGTGVIYGHVKGQRQQLYRIAAAGGAPVDLRFTGPDNPNPYRLSPDGTRIVYSERLLDFSLQIRPVHFPRGGHLPIVPH